MAVVAPPNVSPVLPRWDAQFVTQANGRAVSATEWYNFFKELRARVDADAGLQAEIDAIIARLETLEGSTIVGLNSVQTFGSLSDGLVTVMLRGDVAAPGDFRYYGTGPEGERGFWPAASLVAWLVDRDGNYIVDRDGNYIVGEDISPQLFAITGTEPGFIAHTAAGTWASRTITEGYGITVTNGGGVAGNPVVEVDTAELDARFVNVTGDTMQGDLNFPAGTDVAMPGSLGTASIGTTSSGLIIDNDCSIPDGTSAFVHRFFRNTNTTGVCALQIHQGNGAASTQHNIDGKGDSYVNGMSGNFGIGVTSPTLAKLQIDGNVSPHTDNARTNGLQTRRWSSTFTRDLVLGAGTASLGGGVGVAFVSNATTAPTSNPTGGGLLYAEAGAGKWRGSSGTVTTFGPADPHCPKCGSDFVHEWDNPAKYGYLAVCMLCYARGEKSVTFTRGEWSTH